MNHLENHEHAFLDANNKVINVAVFEESAHDSQLLEDIKNQFKAITVICCCDYGLASINGIWTGTEFCPESPYPSWIWDVTKKEWIAPISKPIDAGSYYWDEPTKSWIEIIVPDESTY